MPASKKKVRKKTTRRKPAGKFLIEILTEIAGRQYYDPVINSGERINLEREPENEHDSNAIRVENGFFQQVGYVPRKISSWLAPLIDAGEVWVEGSVQEALLKLAPRQPHIYIEIYLHRKGRHILMRDPDPRGELEGLHQAMLAVWSGIDGWADGDTVSALYGRLKTFKAEDLLPKTHLLLELFGHRGNALSRQVADRELGRVRDLMKKTRIGKAVFYHNLTIFPLVGGNGHKPDYILLADAIRKKQAEVREVSDEGNVPELIVENRAPLPLLIPEGEILVGAKQNRTVNITILVNAKTEHVIPVSCVEQGRWHRASETFASSHWSTPGLRSMKISTSQVSRRTTGRAFSDQSRVWADVESSLHSAGAFSKTRSITDAYKKAEKIIGKYRKNMILPKGSTGILVAIGDEILGMDLFDSPKTMRKMWPRLSKSYFLDAAFRDKEKKTLKASAAEFVKALPPIIRFAHKPSGAGKELELSGKDYAGAGLWYKDRLCHLSAFRMKRD